MPAPQRRLELEGPVGGGRSRPGEQLVVVVEVVELRLGRVAVEAEPALLERAQRLLQRLGEGAADGHRLADRLHLGAEHTGWCRGTSRTPSGDLGDHVVDRRLEAGRRLRVMSLGISSSV
jgi:hypothetical protein